MAYLIYLIADLALFPGVLDSRVCASVLGECFSRLAAIAGIPGVVPQISDFDTASMLIN
jgi:hypothetical protein